MSSQYTSSYTGPVTSLDPLLQQDLGVLMGQLSSNHNGQPIDDHALQLAISAPNQEQLVAIRDGHAIGAASLSVLPTSFALDGTIVDQSTVWLASFIVHESYRGKLEGETASIASQLWETAVVWAKKHNAYSMEFMTESDRGAAVHFYHHKGAEDVSIANLYNVPLEPTAHLTDVTDSVDGFGIIYETCKTQLALHLYDHKDELTPQDISLHNKHAARRGLSLMQYIAPKDSPAADSLVKAGITPRREEMILRVTL